MGLVNRLRANLRAARQLYARLRVRGYGRWATLFRQLPAAAGLRLYRKFAYPVNDHLFQTCVNHRRFKRFQALHAARLGGHFYLIVMPNTLHFLIPCLELIADEVEILLLINGASAWEADCLHQRWPQMPQFRLAVLPGSSVNHGRMINMLLRHNTRDFGIIDHDLYIFDRSLFDRLQFAEDECLLGVLGDASAKTGWTYPLTHFLYFNAAALRPLMAQYRVGAQSYRRAPPQTRQKLREIGLEDGVFLKHYHDFFDTLHVLLGLGYAEGWRARLVEVTAADGVYHVGGTSIGTYLTKDLVYLYISLRFLELVADAQVTRRYARLMAPFRSSSDLLAVLPGTPQIRQQVVLVDQLLRKLEAEISAGSKASG